MKLKTSGWLLTGIFFLAGSAIALLGLAVGLFIIVALPDKPQQSQPAAIVRYENTAPPTPKYIPPATFTPLPTPLPRPISKSQPEVIALQTDPATLSAPTAVDTPVDETATPLPPTAILPTTTATATPLPPSPKATATATTLPPSPTPPPTATATETPISTATLLPTPTATALPTATSTPSTGQIAGQILLNNTPINAGITIWLEDAAANPVAQTTTATDGRFVFANVPAGDQKYTLVFNNQAQSNQLDMEQAISWGWLGPVFALNGAETSLPAIDLSLLGFAPVAPKPEAGITAATLSAANPLVFQWESYPEATTYWVDVAQGEGQAALWQSTPVQGTSLAFDGAIDADATLGPGEYWWGVGAQRAIEDYTFTVYGYLSEFTVTP